MRMLRSTVSREGRPYLVVRFAGPIAAGSEGNEAARSGRAFIGENLSDAHAGVVLDLTALEYAMGDYVGEWLWRPDKRAVPIRIAAVGPTAHALNGLLSASGLGPLLGRPSVHPTVEAALASMP
jgi:hypothetical protein